MEYERATHWKRLFAQHFDDLYREWLPKGVSAIEAIETLRIPYVPYWSFGERLPVLEEDAYDSGSISYAYDILARVLAKKLDWKEALTGRKLASSPGPRVYTEPRSIDTYWLERNRYVATEGLKQAQRKGFMEVYHLCTTLKLNKNQAELVEIARQAAIHTFGWPIGIVPTREDARPRPTNEGIVTEVVAGVGGYDYWTLTRSGDFYTLTSLFEDERADETIFFNTRIVRATEALMHCIRLYDLFEVGPNAEILFSMRHGGLLNRTLSSTPSRDIIPGRKNSLEKEVVSPTVTFRVGIETPEVVALVKTICEPLFLVFDFAQFDDTIYNDIVIKFLQGTAS